MSSTKKTFSVESTITDLRDEINTIDAELVALLIKRAKVSKAIGETKVFKKGNCSYVPSREKQIFFRLASLVEGSALSQESIEVIYREIISVSRNIQQPERIAVWETDAFIVGRNHFGKASQYKCYPFAKQTLGALFDSSCCLSILSATWLWDDLAWDTLLQMPSEGVYLVDWIGELSALQSWQPGYEEKPALFFCFSRMSFPVNGKAAVVFLLEVERENEVMMEKSLFQEKSDILLHVKRQRENVTRYFIIWAVKSETGSFSWQDMDRFLEPLQRISKILVPLGVIPV